MTEEKEEKGKRERHGGNEDRKTNTEMERERHGWRGSKRQLMREDLRERVREGLYSFHYVGYAAATNLECPDFLESLIPGYQQ